MRNPYIRKIWQLAWTMILCNITVPLLGVVDTMMMGHLYHAKYLAAVGVGVTMFDVLFWAFGFLRMSTTGLTAQALGAKDAEALRLTLLRAGLLALSLAALLVMLRHPLVQLLLFFIKPSANLTPLVLRYFYTRLWVAPATLFNLVALGWFIGMQNTRIPLVTVACVNLIGIGGDFLFVRGLGLTLNGIVYANIIAQYCGLILNVYFIKQLLKRHTGSWGWSKLFNQQKLLALFTINKNIFLRTLCLIVVFTFFTSQGARMGQVILASNVILMNFQMILSFGLDGFVTATEALVGQTIGQANLSDFKLSISASLLWTTLIALLFTLVYALFGQQVINSLTNITQVRQSALHYLPYLIYAPLICAWGFLFDGVFIGATKSQQMLHTMLIAMLTFFGAWCLLKTFANHGLWIAFLCFMAMRSISMSLAFYHAYRRNKFI